MGFSRALTRQSEDNKPRLDHNTARASTDRPVGKPRGDEPAAQACAAPVFAPEKRREAGTDGATKLAQYAGREPRLLGTPTISRRSDSHSETSVVLTVHAVVAW